MKIAEQHYSAQEIDILKNEVLNELRREALKKQIVSELQNEKPKRTIGAFTKHPLFLALFACITGICASYATIYWQRKDWQHQQVRLAQIRITDQKRAFVDELATSIAQANIVDADVLSIYSNDANAEKLTKGEINSRTNWQQTDKNWETNAQRFQQKLSLYFRDPDIAALFKDMIVRKASIRYHLRALPYDSNERFIKRWVKKMFDEPENEKGEISFGMDDVISTNMTAAIEERERLNDDLTRIVKLMKIEIEADELGKQVTEAIVNN